MDTRTTTFNACGAADMATFDNVRGRWMCGDVTQPPPVVVSTHPGQCAGRYSSPLGCAEAYTPVGQHCCLNVAPVGGMNERAMLDGRFYSPA